jgi:ABC-2 type transport system permease protein
MLIYWPALASGMVSTLIADAFAGERERHTLESLLATRLSDRAILIGKVSAAVGYGLSFTLVNLAVGYAVLAIARPDQGAGLPAVPIVQFARIIILVALACATLAGVGVFISLKAATVRQAQQTLGIIMLVIFMGPFLFIQMMGSDARLRLASRMAWLDADRTAMWAMLVLGIAALVLNLAALARFKRGKLALD